MKPSFLKCAACFILVGITSLLAAQDRLPKLQDGPYQSVQTLIGTGGGGNTFPGATLPFGMMQWSPDTNNEAWYRYSDKTIQGFSLTHISGAGCSLYGDFAVLPVVGELSANPATDLANYAVAFDHANEETHPGYYAVTLGNGVRVEITVTERAGIARFTFPQGTPARLLVNAGSSANIDQSEIEVNAGPASSSVRASSHAGHFCSSNSHYTIYAAEQFNKPFKTVKAWQDDGVTDARSAHGKKAGVWLDFGNVREIVLKAAVSFVSSDNAAKNLKTEIPGFNFDAVHARAKAAWSLLLGRFAVEGGTTEQRTKFYTGVYHSFLSPTLFSDADGRYMGFDHTVRTVSKSQRAQYANFSDWDIYRNTVQLQAVFEPMIESDMMQSLVNDAVQGGQLPRWEAANDVTYVMGGDSPVPVIASAYAFGARKFDAASALKFMVKAATETEHNQERPFLEDYLKLGYVPTEKDRTSASRTLEYASDDFAAAQFATALGQRDAAQRFRKLSENWKTLLDPQTKWIRPRHADGSWLEDFDAEKSLPKANGSDQRGFEEGNTAQYTFMIPFDYPALFASIGGDKEVTARLDKFFTRLRCWGDPCFNIENEPDFVTPYAYLFAGEPWKAQDVVTRIGNETFKATPDGIPGNDDLGATSGVYVWNALGLYPAVPGVGGLTIGTPMFDKATLKLGGARTLVITRQGQGIYVTGVRFNGAENKNSWLPFSTLRAGANSLVFTTQSVPDTQRGTAAGDRPPAFR